MWNNNFNLFKQRRLLDQKVPKLFSELTELCEGYVKNYKVYDILVDGMRADKYAENVIESYERDREVQKAQKVTFRESKYPVNFNIS